ncbi:hypothetical protein AMECASPLE_006401 [Ameca splendens]|uniref:Uncharacterized protein n=1 Tax=Ameca splendens TaxID=208324 RepID=A0ABV0YAG5_9TELE
MLRLYPLDDDNQTNVLVKYLTSSHQQNVSPNTNIYQSNELSVASESNLITNRGSLHFLVIAFLLVLIVESRQLRYDKVGVSSKWAVAYFRGRTIRIKQSL